MIVARIAGRFAAGETLSFNPGEAVSSATSPLYALLLGCLGRLGLPPLIAARALGVAATLALGAWLHSRALRFTGRPLHAWLTAGLFLLLPTTVVYSTAGLETPLYTLALALALGAAADGRTLPALAWATAATLLRPDGLLCLAVVAAARLLAHRGERPFPFSGPALRTLGLLGACAAVLGVALALHFAAYGTWLPQSLIAKRAVYSVDPLANTLRYLERMLVSQPHGLPIYGLAVVGAWTTRRRPGSGVLLAWYAVYHAAFFLRAPLFSWYLQPPVFVLVLFAGLGLSTLVPLLERAAGRLSVPRRAVAATLVTGLCLAGLGATWLYAEARRASARYETEVRLATGRWLATNTDRRSLVFTESLGFIGYGAPNPFVDWPGLVSPGVPELVGGHGRFGGYLAILDHHRPEYLALRQSEWEHLQDERPGLRQLARFDAPGGEAYVVAWNPAARRSPTRAREPE